MTKTSTSSTNTVEKISKNGYSVNNYINMVFIYTFSNDA